MAFARALVVAASVCVTSAADVAAQVTLLGDDGQTGVSYQCGEPASKLPAPDVLRVVQDYSLRYARSAIVRRDTGIVRNITGLYHAKEWTRLERLIIDQACSDRVLPVQPLPFPAPGSVVPDVRLARIEGGTPLALSDFRGRLLLLDFWGTWCGACVRQLPKVDSLAREFGDGVTVVAVAYDDTEERVLARLRKTPTRWLIHTIDLDSAVSWAFEIRGAPIAFVIDEDGRIMVSASNPYNHMDLDEFVAFYRRTLAASAFNAVFGALAF